MYIISLHDSVCNLQMPPKGVLAPYDPENYDESFASEYGGYTFAEGAGGGGRGGRGGPRFVDCFIGDHLVIQVEYTVSCV